MIKTGIITFWLCLFVPALLPEVSFAQRPLSTETERIGIADQLLSVGFIPLSVFALVELELGQIRKIPGAIASAKGAGGDTSQDEQLAGVRFPLQLLSSNPTYHIAFFLIGAESVFAATPTRPWSQSKLLENAMSEGVLRRETEDLRKQAAFKEQQASGLEGELKVMRSKAASIIGIDELIQLKLELNRLKNFGQESSTEKARLAKLVEYGWQTQDPEGLDELRLALIQQLKDSALATAGADKINSQKHNAAVSSVQEKLALINQTANKDPEALAQEVLTLRTHRREREKQLRGSIPAPVDDF